jgi:uncharacterized protein
MTERVSTAVATPAEAGTVVAICFGLFIVWSQSAASAGFQTGTALSDATFIETIVIECLLGGAALWFLRGRGHSLRALLPVPTWWSTVVGVALCFGCLVAWGLVSPLFSVAEQAAQPISPLVAASRPTLTMIVLASVVNALYEETFLVGYLVRGFAGLGASLALGISLLVRLLYHAMQGPVGALSVVVFGLVVSLFYWRTRMLWPVVVAHALQDVIALSYHG